jgi:hypothetical protein
MPFFKKTLGERERECRWKIGFSFSLCDSPFIIFSLFLKFG